MANGKLINMTSIELSDSAALRISEILASEKDKTGLRIAVEGGGCTGFQYVYELDSAPNDDDLVLEKLGAKVFIDSVSIPYMEGSVIDFVDNLIGASFQIKNPNAVAACGCGTSFSV